ncbi:type II toxin-antitoxin system VapC family toxin [Candidatus Woesearchaeota archaeon]|nr:type II toxin-antitoxin system VapC family toxin [Candidatus Woesearchaeota archaeon]
MLLDTTFLIDFLRDKKEAVDFLKKIQHFQLYTTEINVFELVVGVYLSQKNPQKHMELISAMLARMTVLPLERKATIKAGELAASAMKKGKTVDHTDSLIAGIALAHGVQQIVTQNKTHFEQFSDVKVYSY